jgi:hypothetical protein
MAHYAFINSDNMVLEVITGRHEDETIEGVVDWETYYTTKRQNLRAIRTSYNTRGGVHYTDSEPSADQSKALRKNYAGIGFTYDEERDAFIPPKPNPTEEVSDWVLNEETCLWEPVSEA